MPKQKSTPLHRAIVERELKTTKVSVRKGKENWVIITIPADMAMPDQLTKTRVERALVRFKACGQHESDTLKHPNVEWKHGETKKRYSRL